ncbi:adenylate kinase [Algiphilus sp.]|uniref:adenylate kinase n=1 Tax=Algiphilus sp. TaxID=1872431 RepID=UPI001CA6D970|nr:adenylate kinase [Algiphilus sp.]MBY8965576.1 adenylate kinase [Algiphilus acroporae]MCI5062529.1 adenylate kinase [Algiphilus sp.]MCI5102683.1 adenylate kinase [Algiphilus sp.]MCR9090679.1 adenylate kinase [Pseudomonadota bacterium]
MSKRIVLLGAPGSGKGTQGQMLMERRGIPQISTGDLLRAAVAAGSDLGLKAKAAMDAGELVADEVVIGMIRERLNEADTANGYILDGFPRTRAQAEALDGLLVDLGKPLDRVVHLDVDEEEIVKRLLERGRSDDTEDTIRNRMKVFRDQTHPLLEYYSERGLLVTVKGSGDLEAIYGSIVAALDA